MARLAIVSSVVPPSASGQAKVLERLIQPADPHDIYFFSERLENSESPSASRPCHAIKLKKAVFNLLEPGRMGSYKHVNNYLGLMRTIARRANEIRRYFGSNPPDAVVGCTGEPFDLAAAYLAAAKMNRPFIAYIFDDPIFQWPKGIYRRLARDLEPVWARGAAAVLCPNEVAADDFVARNPSARPVIVRNPIADGSLPPDLGVPPPASGQPARIVYTGSVYHAQGDAFANLINAMNEMPGRFHLHLYTSQPQSSLDEFGIRGPHVTRHDHLNTPAEVTRTQREADVLFLALAFRSTIQEVLRSSAPAKMGEYLAAGRPILAHAPKGSFVSLFMNGHDAAHVIDVDSMFSLADGMQAIAFNPEVRARCVEGARRAVTGFTLQEAQKQFWGAITRATETSR